MIELQTGLASVLVYLGFHSAEHTLLRVAAILTAVTVIFAIIRRAFRWTRKAADNVERIYAEVDGLGAWRKCVDTKLEEHTEQLGVVADQERRAMRKRLTDFPVVTPVDPPQHRASER